MTEPDNDLDAGALEKAREAAADAFFATLDARECAEAAVRAYRDALPATGAGEWSVGDYVEVRWPDSLWQGYIVGFYTRRNGVQGANIEDDNGNVHNYRLSHLKASPQSRV